MLVALGLLLSTTAANATVIYDDPMTGLDGWSNSTVINAGAYGPIHGKYGSNQSNSNTFSLSGNQTSVDISFRFWALDSWDGETGFLKLDGNTEWSWTRANYNTCVNPEQTYVGSFPTSWNHVKCYKDVTLSFATTSNSLSFALSSNLDQAANDESWAFSELLITDDVQTATVAEPAPLALLGLGLFGLGFMRKRKA